MFKKLAIVVFVIVFMGLGLKAPALAELEFESGEPQKQEEKKVQEEKAPEPNVRIIDDLGSLGKQALDFEVINFENKKVKFSEIIKGKKTFLLFSNAVHPDFWAIQGILSNFSKDHPNLNIISLSSRLVNHETFELAYPPQMKKILNSLGFSFFDLFGLRPKNQAEMDASSLGDFLRFYQVRTPLAQVVFIDEKGIVVYSGSLIFFNKEGLEELFNQHMPK